MGGRACDQDGALLPPVEPTTDQQTLTDDQLWEGVQLCAAADYALANRSVSFEAFADAQGVWEQWLVQHGSVLLDEVRAHRARINGDDQCE